MNMNLDKFKSDGAAAGGVTKSGVGSEKWGFGIISREG